MRVKERLNESDLRRRIMKDESDIIHGRNNIVGELSRVFKMLKEEISEFEEFIELRRERRIKRGIKREVL